MVALPTALFGCAQALGGSGFIAAFVGGLVFSWRAAQIDIKTDLIDAAEGIGEAMAFITWVTFGAIALHQIPSILTPMHVLVAVLALSVFRMVPVYVSLTGSGLSRNAKLFLGWFGPRGLASIVFAVWLIERDVPEAYGIAGVVTVVVVGSILAHGLTAKPLAEAFARSAIRDPNPLVSRRLQNHRLGGETEPPKLATETNADAGLIHAPKPRSLVRQG